MYICNKKWRHRNAILGIIHQWKEQDFSIRFLYRMKLLWLELPLNCYRLQLGREKRSVNLLTNPTYQQRQRNASMNQSESSVLWKASPGLCGVLDTYLCHWQLVCKLPESSIRLVWAREAHLSVLWHFPFWILTWEYVLETPRWMNPRQCLVQPTLEDAVTSVGSFVVCFFFTDFNFDLLSSCKQLNYKAQILMDVKIFF